MPERFTASRWRAEQRGHWSETLAALMLRLSSIEFSPGEIDLVALSVPGLACFIEVKARTDARAASLYLRDGRIWRGAVFGSSSSGGGARLAAPFFTVPCAPTDTRLI